MRREDRWRILEPWVFFIILLLSLSPLFFPLEVIGTFAYTHIYSAHILLDSWGPGSFYSSFYSSQDFAGQGWIATSIMAWLLQFFSSAVVLKIHLALLLLTFAYASRSWIQAFNLRYPWMSLIVFITFWWWPTALADYNFLWGATFSMMAFSVMSRWISKPILVILATLPLSFLVYWSSEMWWWILIFGGTGLSLFQVSRNWNHLKSLVAWSISILPSIYFFWRATASEIMSVSLDSIYGVYFHFGGQVYSVAIPLLALFSLWIISMVLIRQDGKKESRPLVIMTLVLIEAFLVMVYGREVSLSSAFHSMVFAAILLLIPLLIRVQRMSAWIWLANGIIVLSSLFMTLNQIQLQSKYSNDVVLLKQWAMDLPEHSSIEQMESRNSEDARSWLNEFALATLAAENQVKVHFDQNLPDQVFPWTSKSNDAPSQYSLLVGRGEKGVVPSTYEVLKRSSTVTLYRKVD